MDNSVYEMMCHIIVTFTIPSSVSNRKEPFFSQRIAFQQFARAQNAQKIYYLPCKIIRSEFGRPIQRFYYEKTLVGKAREKDDEDDAQGREL